MTANVTPIGSVLDAIENITGSGDAASTANQLTEIGLLTDLKNAQKDDFTNENLVIPAGGFYIDGGLVKFGTMPLTDLGKESKVYATNTGVVASSGNLIRPNNTTPYTAGDVAHGVFEITGLGLPNQLVQLTRAVLKIQVAAIPSGMTTFKLIGHSATPPSAITDNGVYTPTGDGTVYQLTAQSETVVDKGDWLQAEFVLFDGNGFAKLSGTGSLFFYLVTDVGFTPTALAVKTVDLYVVGL